MFDYINITILENIVYVIHIQYNHNIYIIEHQSFTYDEKNKSRTGKDY